MNSPKPGRVLFWVTVTCIVLFFLDGALLENRLIDTTTAGALGMLSLAGWFTGIAWLKLKWVQAKARARYSAKAGY